MSALSNAREMSEAAFVACDQCNHRKIKCRALEPTRPSSAQQDRPCRGCSRTGLQCTTKRRLKRRGPKWKTDNPAIQPITPTSLTDPRSLGSSTSPNSHGLPHSEVSSAPLYTPAHASILISPSQVEPNIHDPNQSSNTFSFPLETPDIQDLFSGIEFDGTPLPFASISETGGSFTGPLSSTSSTTTTASVWLSAAESVVQASLRDRQIPAPDPLPDDSATMQTRIRQLYPSVWVYLPVVSQEEFYAAMICNEHDRSATFRALVLSVAALGLGGSVIQSAKDNTEICDLAKRYVSASQRCLAISDTQEESTGSIAHIVVCLHLFLVREWLGQPLMAWNMLQSAITRAQMLKMDRWSTQIRDLQPSQMAWLTTRLKLYHLMCVFERSHALLCSEESYINQALRLDGKPYASTFHLLSLMEPDSMAAFQRGHMEMFDCIDDMLIRCARGRCRLANESGPDICWEWSEENVEAIQSRLSNQLEQVSTEVAQTMLPIQAHLCLGIVFVQKLVHGVAFTHGLVTPWAKLPCLQFDYISKQLKQVLDDCQVPLQVACRLDITRETCDRLATLAETVVTLAVKCEELGGPRLHTYPLITRCLEVVLVAVPDHQSVRTLINLAAKIKL